MDKSQYMNTVSGGELTYEKSRELATAKNLSRHEKIGFPNRYREGYADFILDAPEEIKRLRYSRVENSDKMNFYVYNFN